MPNPQPTPRATPLPDENLHALLRMAGEIERFEFDAAYQEIGDTSTPLNLVRSLPTRRSDSPVLRRLLAGAAGIAACLALAFVASRGISSSSGPEVIIAKAADRAGVDELIASMLAKYRESFEIRPVAHDGTSPSDRSMMLAVFKDADAPCACVLWKPVNFDGRPLSEVSRSELVAAAYDAGQHDHCSANAPLAFVMGLEGPGDSLPAGHAAAEALASCVAQTQPPCGDDNACYTDNALRCLPEGVNVLAQSLPQ